MSQKIITSLFAYAKQEKAENVVISSKSDRISFNYHFSGFSSKTISLPKRYEASLLKKIGNVLKLGEDEIVTEKETKANLKGQDYHCRVSVIPSSKEKRIIIKFNWQKPGSWRLTELGLKTEERKIITKSLQIKKGLILITGQEASGKSAVINAISQELVKQNKSVYFLYNQEKPAINDFSIVKLSDKAIEYANRHNADIIIMDEIENKNNLAEAFKLADKGYLVIASYRAKNLKEVGIHAQEALKNDKSSLKSLKLGILTKLEKLNRQKDKKHDKRTMIGRFKLTSFIK